MLTVNRCCTVSFTPNLQITLVDGSVKSHSFSSAFALVSLKFHVLAFAGVLKIFTR